jgi:hypothetical protein
MRKVGTQPLDEPKAAFLFSMRFSSSAEILSGCHAATALEPAVEIEEILNLTSPTPNMILLDNRRSSSAANGKSYPISPLKS